MGRPANDYELEVSLGGASFRGKGPEAFVRRDYERFLRVLDKLPRAAASGQMRSVGKPWPTITPPLHEIFEAHEDGCLALRKRLSAPLKEQRSLVVLLYGYLMIEQEPLVPAGHLLVSAGRSKIKTDRVDRLLQRYLDKGFVEKVGSKRGSHYRLSETGVEFAMSQIEQKEWK